MSSVSAVPTFRKPIPVFHASIQGISGAYVELGGVGYLSPVEDLSLYAVTDMRQLIVSGPIAEPVASLVREQISSKLQHGRLVRAQGRAAL